MISILNFKSLKEGLLIDHVAKNSIMFYPDDIYNKYGFADGDLLTDLFYEFYEKNEIKADSSLPHKALYEVVKTLVFANISPNTELDFWSCTVHNPVRAGKDDYEDFSSDPFFVEILDIFTVFDRVINEAE
jgi:hypothetical protein